MPHTFNFFENIKIHLRKLRLITLTSIQHLIMQLDNYMKQNGPFLIINMKLQLHSMNCFNSLQAYLRINNLYMT